MVTASLGDVVDVAAGQPAPPPGEFSAEGTPFVRAGSLESLLNGRTEDDCEKIASDVAQRRGLRLFPEDTVLFAKSGMSAKLGRVYRLRQPSYVVSHLAALSPTGRYHPGYLTYWLRQFPPSSLIRDDAYPSIRVSEIEELQVPDIDFDEQRRIAAILDKADAIRRKREQALTLADDLLKSAFLEMFGELEQNPHGWRCKPLGQLLAIDPQNGLYRPSSDYGSGVPILRIDGFYDGYLVTDAPLKRLRIDRPTVEKYRLNEGDVVINRVNSKEYLGKSALIEDVAEDTVFESNMMRFSVREDELSPRFLVDQLQTVFIRRQIMRASKDAVNQSSINQTDVKNLSVRIPPADLQRKYARLVAATANSRNEMKRARMAAELLFASLSQRAFRGEL